MAEVETAQERQIAKPRQAGVAERAAGPLGEAISIMARLRAPGGCPWDREQTFDTIKRYTLEETYEVFDAIERRAWPELKDELGDLLLQVLFYAQMAAEAVLRNWDEIKRGEKRATGETATASVLEAIPRSMPAVMEAGKLGSKAAKVGFDWPDAQGVFEKLQEEIDELTAEMEKAKTAELTRSEEKKETRIEEELGDILFTAVNLARHLKVDAESALRGANAKFRTRFGAMETSAGGFDALASLIPAELDALWNRAKLENDAKQKRQTGNEPDSSVADGLKA